MLRAARRQLCSLPGKVVVATGTGAHLASLTAAIQEGVSALIDKDAFIERVVLPPSLSESAGAPRVGPLPGALAPSVQEVQVTLGLDKGGDPGTVKIVAAIINQAHTNKSSNTILAGVCPCDDDKYEDLKKMLLTHQPQVVALLREGVLVRGERWPVRMFLGGDYAAQCDMLGHKGASATQLCLYCLSTRSPSAAQRLLDATYGTLQDVVVGRRLREASYYSTRMLAEGAVPAFGDRGSVERSPLLAIVPGQIVPIPLHATIGINFRYLRLAIEMVMLCASASQDAARWRQAGAAFALELVEILHNQVRVRPTSFQGGLFIGRDCHTIGDSWAVVCAALKGRVSDGHLAAYEEACTMWNRVRTTLNRASVVPADEVRSFQADTAGMVSLLKTSFPWLSISPKLHILMCMLPLFCSGSGVSDCMGNRGLKPGTGGTVRTLTSTLAPRSLSAPRRSCGRWRWRGRRGPKCWRATPPRGGPARREHTRPPRRATNDAERTSRSCQRAALRPARPPKRATSGRLAYARRLLRPLERTSCAKNRGSKMFLASMIAPAAAHTRWSERRRYRRCNSDACRRRWRRTRSGRRRHAHSAKQVPTPHSRWSTPRG